MRSPSSIDAGRQTWADDQLMLAYANGDAAAFDELYARHEGALLRFVRRLLGRAHVAQAEEVFQDAWMRIVAARATYVPQGASWRTWAFTIAHNLAMDRLRVSGRELPLMQAHDEDEDEPAALRAASLAQVSTDDQAFWRAGGRRLLACLEELPADQRAAFLLQHEEGLSVEALAAQVGLNFETAKSRLRYALKKLRACMASYLQVLEARA